MLELERNSPIEAIALSEFFARCGWEESEAATKLEWALAASDEWVVCRLDGQLIGFGRLCRLDPVKRVVFDVLVDPRFRETGLGHEIVRLLTENADNLEGVPAFKAPLASPQAYLGRSCELLLRCCSARQSMSGHRVICIPGDGIGPEIMAAAKVAVSAAGAAIEWVDMDAGAGVIEKYGTPLPEAVIEAIRVTGVALKGPVTTPVGSGFRSVNVALRKALDLYANLRPAANMPGIRSRYEGIDLVIVRENTEDLYAGIERMADPDTAESVKIITRKGSERIARFAFEYARREGRQRVTAVHKANIMKMSDGLFLEVSRQVAQGFPEVEFDDRIVDNMCMQLVQYPEAYDVLLCPNLYGDIISDLCAGLVGGLGVAPGANIGEGIAVFEAVHGSAPDIAGQDRANPTALVLSAVAMLSHLGEVKAARALLEGTRAVISAGDRVTADLGGTAGTMEMGEAIAEEAGRQAG